MNIEVQSTDKTQRPQLLKEVDKILLLTLLERSGSSPLTNAIVRVQGPKQRQRFRFHDNANGTTAPS